MNQNHYVLPEPENVSSWQNLTRVPHHERKAWIKKNLPAITKTLEKISFDSRDIHPVTHVSAEGYRSPWDIIGFICLDDNLYEEAESIYDVTINKAKSKHMHFGASAYNLGVARFLQGRYQQAHEDFKTAKIEDMAIKNFDTPATRAISYMEQTIFPTKTSINKNQQKLVKDLNAPRFVEKIVGPYVLRTIHKWNSSSPLFSQGISQGGGYFLTLKNAAGETKGIAIDPGYDFFDIFKDLGLGIADIDAIIITHDHDDHTQSVEAILSLLAKYNDHNLEKKSKVIDIFGSPGAMLKFQGALSATDPYGSKEINFQLLIPGKTVTSVDHAKTMEKYGFNLYVKQAHHTEMWTNQESSVGVVLETRIKEKGTGPLFIGITGDSRYEPGLGKQYSDSQIILLNIGSIEPEEGKFLSQHLGMCGCINLIKEARLGQPTLAILTEFGEEFKGRREIISKIIENWAQPMSSPETSLKVIPADVHLELKLSDMTIRETDTNVFFPYNMIDVEEADPEIIRYKFKG
jgi:tetratricopeptide (TPR) repeat protein